MGKFRMEDASYLLRMEKQARSSNYTEHGSQKTRPNFS